MMRGLGWFFLLFGLWLLSGAVFDYFHECECPVKIESKE